MKDIKEDEARRKDCPFKNYTNCNAGACMAWTWRTELKRTNIADKPTEELETDQGFCRLIP